MRYPYHTFKHISLSLVSRAAISGKSHESFEDKDCQLSLPYTHTSLSLSLASTSALSRGSHWNTCGAGFTISKQISLSHRTASYPYRTLTRLPLSCLYKRYLSGVSLEHLWCWFYRHPVIPTVHSHVSLSLVSTSAVSGVSLEHCGTGITIIKYSSLSHRTASYPYRTFTRLPLSCLYKRCLGGLTGTSVVLVLLKVNQTVSPTGQPVIPTVHSHVSLSLVSTSAISRGSHWNICGAGFTVSKQNSLSHRTASYPYRTLTRLPLSCLYKRYLSGVSLEHLWCWFYRQPVIPTVHSHVSLSLVSTSAVSGVSLEHCGTGLPVIPTVHSHVSLSLVSTSAVSGVSLETAAQDSQLSLPYTHTSPSLLSLQALSLGGLTGTSVVLVLQTASYPYRTLTRLPLSCLYKRCLGVSLEHCGTGITIIKYSSLSHRTASYPYRTFTRLPLSCLYKRCLGGLTGTSVVLVLLKVNQTVSPTGQPVIPTVHSHVSLSLVSTSAISGVSLEHLWCWFYRQPVIPTVHSHVSLSLVSTSAVSGVSLEHCGTSITIIKYSSLSHRTASYPYRTFTRLPLSCLYKRCLGGVTGTLRHRTASYPYRTLTRLPLSCLYKRCLGGVTGNCGTGITVIKYNSLSHRTASYPYCTLTRLPLSCFYKRSLGGLTGTSVVLVLLINVLLMLEFPIHS
ncbi:hypothetical protein J6590_090264 [Homalodisca vitripennis]|nr:hypothetical protein J6590_090264 [Homalodisca vitripennis]